MAFVGLASGISGDLNSATYQFGYFDDIVLIVDGNARSYNVRTYEGNDVIDNRRTTGGTFGVTVDAGIGNDTIYGGASSDTYDDYLGNDTALLGSGGDRVYVGAGNDTYDGGAGSDSLNFDLTPLGDGSRIVNRSSVMWTSPRRPLKSSAFLAPMSSATSRTSTAATVTTYSSARRAKTP